MSNKSEFEKGDYFFLQLFYLKVQVILVLDQNGVNNGSSPSPTVSVQENSDCQQVDFSNVGLDPSIQKRK
jgi:hypothetical protein